LTLTANRFPADNFPDMAERPSSTGLDALVALTPDTRDRFMDFLRAASIVSVVFGHWLISVIFWRDGVIYTTSAIGVTRGLWLATWVFQVMPIFFFVGGFSNLVTYESYRRRGLSTWTFIRGRLERLLRPSLIFLGLWVLIQIVLHLADVGRSTGPQLWGDTYLLRGMFPPGSTLPFGPLWFLGMYMIVVSISPLTIRLHRRYGWLVPAVCVAGAIAADVVGFGLGFHGVRYANVAFVLLLPHQLGHFYADGSFARLPRKVFWAMVATGLAMLVLLTNPYLFRAIGGAARFEWFPGIGYYPRSLLGTDVESISNAYPPTLCYLAVGIWTIGAVMLLRERLSRWLQKPRPWKAAILANSIIMTLFLWHMTAFLLAVLALWPLGLGRQTSGTTAWWIERIAWIGIPAIILAVLVAIFGRFERPPAARKGIAVRPGSP
jgi:fucose 4-O-acetylase-like acetyltransferase